MFHLTVAEPDLIRVMFMSQLLLSMAWGYNIPRMGFSNRHILYTSPYGLFFYPLMLGVGAPLALGMVLLCLNLVWMAIIVQHREKLELVSGCLMVVCVSVFVWVSFVLMDRGV